jgi:hypothetical protein
MPTDVHPGGVVRAVSAAAERAPRARYLPIAEHGLIGDLHTVADSYRTAQTRRRRTPL